MPILANAKQELYCKHRANGFIPRKAALAAGYVAGSGIYSELEKQPEIIARVHELVEERQAAADARKTALQQAAHVAGDLAGTSQAWVLEQLKVNAEEARDSGAFKESNEALKMIGEAIGMWGDKGSGGREARGPGLEQVLDMDALDKLIEVTDRLEQQTQPAEGVQLVEQSRVLALLEGHGGNARSIAKDREFTTGSETDVALQVDTDPVPLKDPE